MKRKASGESSFRRKSPYRPIMLTSKSMKPVERSSPDKTRSSQRREFDHSSSTHRKKPSLNCMIYANSITRAEIVRKLTEQYRENLLKSFDKPQADPDKSLKPHSASIVQMEFESEEYSLRSNARYQELLSNLSFEGRRGDTPIIKNYDDPLSAAKARINNTSGFAKKKKWIRSPPEETLHLLDKHYLKIKKVDPKLKHNMPELNLSPEKLTEISQKVEDYQNLLIQKMEQKYRVTSSSAVPGRSPKKNLDFSQEITLRTDQTRIQEDMQSKRTVGKKEYFIFGLSDASKISSDNSNRNKFEIYKDFLWKINFSNGLYIRIKDEIESPYKAYVGAGNNSMIIKGILRRRFWWQFVEKLGDDTNFVWTQLKVNQFFKLQPVSSTAVKSHPRNSVIVRHRKVRSSLDFQPKDSDNEGKQQSEISFHQKKELKEKQQDSIETHCQHQKILCGQDLNLWEKHYKLHKKHEKKLQNYLPKRISTLVRRKRLKFVEDSKGLRLQNHFECNYFLGNKKALFYSMRTYYRLLGRDPFANIPLTFHISKGLADPEYERFLEHYQVLQEQKKRKEIQNIWIVKPGQFTNRGRGITVCSILDDIKIRLKSKEKSKMNEPHTYIVQKYIEKPLLYNRRKFDIRHYMLMTCTNGRFKGYWYSEGYLRTTSFEYNIKNCKDLYTHLTNDAVQKYSADYGKYEKCNKISYSDFQKYLNSTYKQPQKYDFFNRSLPQMKEIAADTMKATYMRLSPTKREHNFELFGLDFMLDEDMNVYLIEVNTNPCLEVSCPLLGKLLSGLLENLFKICLDPLFPPPYEWQAGKKMQFGENCLEENKFSLVFDETEDGESLSRLYENSSEVEEMGNIDQEDEEFQDEGKEWVED